MTDEDLLEADHHGLLVRAARVAQSKGVTKKQFLAASGLFWDTFEKLGVFLEKEKKAGAND